MSLASMLDLGIGTRLGTTPGSRLGDSFLSKLGLEVGKELGKQLGCKLGLKVINPMSYFNSLDRSNKSLSIQQSGGVTRRLPGHENLLYHYIYNFFFYSSYSTMEREETGQL